MIKYLTIFFLLFSFACFGQDDKRGTIKVKKVETEKIDTTMNMIVLEKDVKTPLTIVEQMPTFPGGNQAMNKFIQENLKFPSLDYPILGTTYVTFVVEIDGSLTDIKILRGTPNCSACDQEALRVVKMMPKWNAGKQNGRTVRVQYNLPIKFSLK